MSSKTRTTHKEPAYCGFETAAASQEAESRARLAAIVDSSDDAIISKDLNGIIMTWNSSATRLFGYTADEAIGQSITMLMPRERVDEERVILERIRSGDRIDHYETVRRRKDGTLVDISLTVSPLMDVQGRVLGASKIARDITERKQAEERLRQSEDALRRQRDQFTTLVEHIPDIVARLDRDLRFIYISPAVLAVTGIPPEEYLGKPRKNTGISDEHVKARDELSRLAFETGQEQTLELPIQTPAGERYFETRLVPEFAADGSVESLMTLTRDITERKQMEESLRRREVQFRQLADAMPQIVWTARPDGYIDYYNERWYEYTGFPRGEFGQSSWQPILHPDDVQRCTDTYFGCIQAEKPYQIEYRFKDRRTGGYRWFLGRAIPVRDETGKVSRWFGTCTDIDDTKRAEEVLQEADRRKDEFLATLAHELRNPLAPIRNSLDILRMAASSEPAVERIRDIMERQVNQMVRLVDDLLEVSRISRGNIELKKERVEFAAIVRAAVETSTPLIELARHQLTVTLPPEPLTLHCDAARLTQVIANLLNNSAKYSKKASRIWLEVRRDGGNVVLSVRDNGNGISADVMPRIFEMFTQGERGRGGLGIGLALVRNIVRMHDGTVEAHSEGIGHGSEFVVRLPLASDVVISADRNREGVQPPTLLPRRILLVDDNRDVAHSLGMVLTFLGADVHVVHDGQSALEAINIIKPNIIFLDIGMPDMTGYEVARRIRQQPGVGDVTLVALTGWGQEEDRRRSAAAGFHHHLVKPVTLEALQALLLSLEQGTGQSVVTHGASRGPME